ncbi:MAG TPA: hypothetical protein VF744_21405, partial [Beijerinckiaceae bacterium]
IPWSMALRDLRREPARGGVREEPLRAAAALGALGLTSWRGRSGRRYVVGVHPLTEAEALAVADAVMIAVRRDDDGIAAVVEPAAAGAGFGTAAKRAWVSRARALGATELHVHRLAEDEGARQAIVADLLADEATLTGLARDAPAPGR